MTRLLIDNSERTGAAVNMTTSEFRDAVFYPGTDHHPARYRVHVKNPKTAGVHGAAVFVSSNGLELMSSQVSHSVFRTFQREGIDVKGRISATTIRKSLTMGMHTHMPYQKDNLAALAQHKPQMQAKYYHIHDKVSETVKNLVSKNS